MESEILKATPTVRHRQAKLSKPDEEGYIRVLLRISPQMGKILQREATRSVLTIPALCRTFVEEGLKRRILENERFFGIRGEEGMNEQSYFIGVSDKRP